jgi:hypothetical protein
MENYKFEGSQKEVKLLSTSSGKNRCGGGEVKSEIVRRDIRIWGTQGGSEN